MRIGHFSPKASPDAPSSSAPRAGQARVIWPHKASTRPRIAGAAAICASCCTEMPCSEALAPISAAQSRPTENQSVAIKAAVARACHSPARMASRVAPCTRPRAASHSPATNAPMPKQAVSMARDSAPRWKCRSTRGGSISCTLRSNTPMIAA
jgi:hypothetical protein